MPQPPADHYFTRTPGSAHAHLEWEAVLRGRRLRFVTDAGVFSRTRVDPGTRLLIDSIEVPQRGNVLDLGCGYGPLGIAMAALQPAAFVYLVDVNERAAGLARLNLAKNGIRNAEVRVGEGFAPVADLRFALIASNPPMRAGKEVVYPLVEQSHAHMERGGRLWLVALTRQGAKTLARKVEEVYGNVAVAERGGGYRVLVAERA